MRHQVRGTLATSSQRYWKKFKCRQRLSMVSCTPHKALQSGHSKCSPGRCSIRNSKRLGSPSKRHWATRHCLPSPSAAVKSSSGVILLIESTLTQNANPPPLFGTRTKYQQLLRLRGRSEERAKGYRTQNAVTFPARSEACSSEKRNKWQGPASGGKDAVYAGFDLEQASRSAIRLGSSK